MGDVDAEGQLLRGFYAMEGAGWRWTASRFAVALAKPEGKNSTLEFKFSLPQVVVDQRGALTLAAEINGSKLPSQTYSKAGEYVYSAPVGAGVLKATNTVEFSTDKKIGPAAGDKRELALVAVSVGFTDAPH